MILYYNFYLHVQLVTYNLYEWLDSNCLGLYSAGYAEITSDWLVKSDNEQLDLSAHIRVMVGQICTVL